MIESDRAVEAQHVVPPLEARQRDAVAEHVVQPAQRDRLRLDDQPRLDQPLIVAVARPEHHAMLAERDRLAVAIGRDVTDREQLASALAVRVRVEIG